MKSQIILKTVDIDNRKYDENNLLDEGINQTYTNVFTGACNYYRSQIIFNNINLRQCIKNYNSKNKFNLKLIKIEDVKMRNNTLINETIDNASNLCSNLYINGLDFVGGLKNQRLLTTVKIPNFQNQITALFALQGPPGVSYTFFHSAAGQSDSTMLQRFLINNIPQNTVQYFRMRTFNPATGSSLDPQIENVILEFTSYTIVSTTNTRLENIKIVSNQQNTTWITSPNNVNLTVYFEFLPNANLNYNFVENKSQQINNELLTFYKPANDVVNIILEMRDILTDKIQPIAATTGIYPSYTYHLEIE